MNINTSVSALQAADVRMAVSANNVANVFTPKFRASMVAVREQPGGGGVDTVTLKTDHGTDLVDEQVGQIITANYAKANGAVIKVTSDMIKSVISLVG